MTSVLITLLIVAVMPYLAKLPLVWAMQQAGGYDNHYPRQQQARLDLFGQRCNAAHYNSFEALAFYSVAIIMLIATSLYTPMVITLCWSFVLLRILYLLCYWFDWATPRSLVWVASMAVAISLMLMAIAAV